MRLDEKRAAIEALTCAAADANNVSLNDALFAVELGGSAARHALDVSYLHAPAGTLRFGDRMAEVAYRLIESSPALRREWFGR